MISLQLDTLGRLQWLEVAPARLTDGSAADAAVDWTGLFDLMGLDMAEFTPVEPRLSPRQFVDERAAWEGAFPEDPEVSLRIEAAAQGGRPTSLRLFTPYDPLETPTSSSSGSGSGISLVGAAVIAIILVIILSVFTAIFGGLYIAQRNVRAGRGDTRGARRLGFAIAGALGITWFVGDHTYSPSDVNDFMLLLMLVSAVGGLTWALYLAVEPFMRRHAPEALIGWTRFIDGRLSDPLVGRDILIGCAAGALSRLVTVLPLAVGDRSLTAGAYAGLPQTSLLNLLGRMTNNAAQIVILALALSFLYSLTFLALGRRPWAAFAIWLFFLGAIGFIPGLIVNNAQPAASLLTSIFWTLGWALWLFILFRRGILAFLVMGTTAWLLSASLPTLDFAAWYGSTVVAGLLMFIGLAAYAFYRCAAWKGGLADALVGE